MVLVFLIFFTQLEDGSGTGSVSPTQMSPREAHMKPTKAKTERSKPFFVCLFFFCQFLILFSADLRGSLRGHGGMDDSETAPTKTGSKKGHRR